MIIIETIRNEDYNFIKKRMLRLEEAYKQSNDQKVRQLVKEQVLYEISERFPRFLEEYAASFANCQMSSLREITELTVHVLSKYSVEKLPPLTEKEAKRVLKLKDKALKLFVRGYNAAIVSKDLTYYSQRIDDKLVFFTTQDNMPLGLVSSINPNVRNKECMCYFCKQFRRGKNIVFITNSVKTKEGNYSCIGQTVCSDYEMCNRSIESNKTLVKFFKYKLGNNEDK